MHIDEAIEVLKIDIEDCDRLNEPRNKEALKLGIEALEAYAQARRSGLPLRCELLPRETKD